MSYLLGHFLHFRHLSCLQTAAALCALFLFWVDAWEGSADSEGCTEHGVLLLGFSWER